MNRISIALVLTATLSACGGGGGSSGNANTTVPPAAAPAPAPAVVDLIPTVGDFYSYSGTETFTPDQPGSTQQTRTQFFTEAASEANVDGWVDTGIEEDPTAEAVRFRYLADGGLTAVTTATCGAGYTPASYWSQKDLAVGTTWTSDYQRIDTGPCAARRTGKTSGKVVALETLTVVAGTFNTVKVQLTHTASNSDGSSVIDNATQWRDVVTHRVIKSTTVSNHVSSTGAKATATSTSELYGFASAKQGRQKLNIERFVGALAGTYAGGASGNCAGQVTRDGKLDVSCGDNLFTVHGDVDSAGNGTFYLMANGVKGANFSGSFTSPLGISGAWSAGSASGTWTLGRP